MVKKFLSVLITVLIIFALVPSAFADDQGQVPSDSAQATETAEPTPANETTAEPTLQPTDMTEPVPTPVETAEPAPTEPAATVQSVSGNVDAMDTTVISTNTVLSKKGNYNYAGIYQYDNLTLADGVHVTSSGISQLVINVKGTLTIGKGADIRVRNGYYPGAPSLSVSTINYVNYKSIGVNMGSYNLYPGTYGKGGNGGYGGNGSSNSWGGYGGGGGGGGYGGGQGGSGGTAGTNTVSGHFTASNGYPGDSNGGYGGVGTGATNAEGGGATGVGENGVDGEYVGNSGSGGGGNGGNGGRGNFSSSYPYNGQGGSGGGGGGYGGGVLTIIANKIVVNSDSPCFIASGQLGGAAGNKGGIAQSGASGEGGMLIIYTNGYSFKTSDWTANDMRPNIGVPITTYGGGHGLLTGAPQLVIINGVQVMNGSETVPQNGIPLGIPTLLSAQQSGNDSVMLSWTAVADVSGYEIYYSTSSSGNYTKCATIASGSTLSGQVSGLTAGAYYFKVRAYSDNGNYSDFSSVVPVALAANTNMLYITASSGNTAFGSVSGGGSFTKGASVTLTATPNAGYRFTGWYKDTALVSSDATYTFSAAESLTLTAQFDLASNCIIAASSGNTSYGSVSGGGSVASGTSVTLTATPNAGYYFTGWYNGTALVSASASYTFSASTDINLIAQFDRIGVPETITASASAYNKITVRWSPVAGAKGYYVYRSASADGAYKKIAASKKTSYVNSGVTTGTTYYYKVAPYTKSYTGKYYSDVASAASALGQVTRVTAKSAKPTKVVIKWKAVTGAKKYQVLRSDTMDGDYTAVKMTSSKSITDTGLIPGNTYFYKVVAYRGSAYGPDSDVVSVTTKAVG